MISLYLFLLSPAWILCFITVIISLRTPSAPAPCLVFVVSSFSKTSSPVKPNSMPTANLHALELLPGCGLKKSTESRWLVLFQICDQKSLEVIFVSINKFTNLLLRAPSSFPHSPLNWINCPEDQTICIPRHISRSWFLKLSPLSYFDISPLFQITRISLQRSITSATFLFFLIFIHFSPIIPLLCSPVW